MSAVRRAVGAIVAVPGRGIVLVRKVLRQDADPAECDEWNIPQGGVKEGETDEGALARELLEELGTPEVAIVGKLPFKIEFDFEKGGRYGRQETTLFAARYDGKVGAIKPKSNEIKETAILSPDDATARISFPESREAVRKALQTRALRALLY